MKVLIILLIIFICFFKDIKIFFYSIVKPKINKFEPVPFKKRKIAIITAENRNDDYIKYHDLNCEKYSQINNYDYFRLNICDPSEASIYWCKIYKVKQYLDSNEYDYILWLDSDTIFTNDTPIDYFISKFGEPDIIIGNDDHILLKGLNAGIFLIKNSEIGKSFINECINTIEQSPNCIKNGKEQGIWAGMCYEQGVMTLLLREKYKTEYYLDQGEFIKNIIDFDINKKYELSLITHLPNSKIDSRNIFFKDYV